MPLVKLELTMTDEEARQLAERLIAGRPMTEETNQEGLYLLGVALMTGDVMRTPNNGNATLKFETVASTEYLNGSDNAVQ